MAYLDALDSRPDEAAIMLELAGPIDDVLEIRAARGVGIGFGAVET